ncbi:MAG: RecQ family ATP-dependent DNA helicase [Spirochaetales bacterium]
MNPDWLPALKALKVSYLFPYQELAIAQILGPPGLRQGVILPTGAGKSLCFQVPALLFDKPTLVVYPLRSLMADQKRRCEQAGIACAVLQGGQTREQRRKVQQRLQAGQVKLLLTNPETLIQPAVKKMLSTVTFAHAVIDEAHCITLWGKDFRPTYRELPGVLESLQPERISAFTATASPRVTEDWTQHLFQGQPWSLIRAAADRTNLDFAREPYLSLRFTLPRLLTREARPALVFCRNREGVRRWAHHILRETGLDVRHYHAGMTKEEKTSVEDWFFQSADGVLCATNAYGMGIDKSGIRTVIHLDVSNNAEDYLQEAGRAGRDGRPSRALMLTRAKVGGTPEPTCWRKKLLAVFEEEPVICSGCDACRGQTMWLPAELTRTCGLLYRYRGKLDRKECQALLRGRAEPGLEALRLWPGWGMWSGLDDLTFRELWAGLEDGGWLVFGKREGALLRKVSLN